MSDIARRTVVTVPHTYVRRSRHMPGDLGISHWILAYVTKSWHMSGLGRRTLVTVPHTYVRRSRILSWS